MKKNKNHKNLPTQEESKELEKLYKSNQLDVLEKTATAMIVRNASEIHTGDYVELQ